MLNRAGPDRSTGWYTSNTLPSPNPEFTRNPSVTPDTAPDTARPCSKPSHVPGDQFANRNRAVLFENGQAVDLNTRVVNLPATVSLSSANAINDSGVIVGNSCLLPCNPFQSTGTAFMLIPNP